MDRRKHNELGVSNKTDKSPGSTYRPPWTDGGGKSNKSGQFPDSKQTQGEGLSERLQYDKLDKDKLKEINNALTPLAIKWLETYTKTQTSEANNFTQIYFDAIETIDDFVERDSSPEKWSEIVASDNLAMRAARYVLQHNLNPEIAFGFPTGSRPTEKDLIAQEILQSSYSDQALRAYTSQDHSPSLTYHSNTKLYSDSEGVSSETNMQTDASHLTTAPTGIESTYQEGEINRHYFTPEEVSLTTSTSHSDRVSTEIESYDNYLPQNMQQSDIKEPSGLTQKLHTEYQRILSDFNRVFPSGNESTTQSDISDNQAISIVEQLRSNAKTIGSTGITNRVLSDAARSLENRSKNKSENTKNQCLVMAEALRWLRDSFVDADNNNYTRITMVKMIAREIEPLEEKMKIERKTNKEKNSPNVSELITVFSGNPAYVDYEFKPWVNRDSTSFNQ